MTLVVGTNTFVTQAAADAYMASHARGSVSWGALGDPAKEIYLVTAFRELQRLCYKGAKTGGSAQTAAWPRTSVLDREGDPIDENTIPDDIKNAQIEYAYELSVNANIEKDPSSRNNRKRLKAGPVELENFRPLAGRAYPRVVSEFLAPYLCTDSTTASVGAAYGTTATSKFDDCDAMGLDSGYP